MKKVFNNEKNNAAYVRENTTEIICALKDDELNVFHKPMFFRSRVEAMQNLRNSILVGTDNLILKLADRMTAYIMGEYDESAGKLFCYEEPIFLCRLADFVTKEVSEV